MALLRPKFSTSNLLNARSCIAGFEHPEVPALVLRPVHGRVGLPQEVVGIVGSGVT